MKYYIFTVPKAGTYLAAEFLERMGIHNTGLHVFQDFALDTKSFDAKTNAERPSRTQIDLPFRDALRRVGDGQLAFGHFPAPLDPWATRSFRTLISYRHPRKTLVAEFVDFRFRRRDVGWLGKNKIPDDREAFVAYLEKAGENQMAVLRAMLVTTGLFRAPLPLWWRSRMVHMNFDTFLRDPGEAVRVARALRLDPDRAPRAYEEAKAAETKTKATGLTIDRDALWSDAAERAYDRLGAEPLLERARKRGWDI